MARTTPFAGVPEFLAVAEQASFRAAAADLGVTPAAVSQAIRSLETRVGLSLFQRTTRRVALTEAGASLFERLAPATAGVREAFDALASLRQTPSGRLRLSVPRIALSLVVEPLLPELRKAYPQIEVELEVDDRSVDLTAKKFDAGIRVGGHIARDMIAVPVTPSGQWLVLGSPAYMAAAGRPRTPADLRGHECIRYRFPTARSLQRWEFVRGTRTTSIDPPGSVVVNDTQTLIALARRDMGLIYTGDILVRGDLASGLLEAVLGGFTPKTPGLYVYFAARSREQPKLRALLTVLRRVVKTR